jgi:hypothetical protein
LIVPVGATILTTHDGLTEEGFFNQALRPVNDSSVFPAGRLGSQLRRLRDCRRHTRSWRPSVGAAWQPCPAAGVRLTRT